MRSLYRRLSSVVVVLSLMFPLTINSDDRPSSVLDDGRSGEQTRSLISSPGVQDPAINSRGALVAQTWRDWMANSTMGRTIAINPVGSGLPGVQFSYMVKASANSVDRNRWGWAAYDAISGQFVPVGGKTIVQSDTANSPESGSYPKIAVNSTGHAVIGGYDFPNQVLSPTVTNMHTVLDASAMIGNFGDISSGSIMAEAVRDQSSYGGGETIWPTMDIYEAGGVTTIYLAAWENVSPPTGALKVFRKVGWGGSNPDASWSLVFTDTTFYPTQDIACSPTGRVGVAWTKFSAGGHVSGDTFDNDVWIAISSDGSPGTWIRTNVTNYTGAGYRAWLEVAALFDTSDKFHVIWNAGETDGVDFGNRSCRLFHWSENNPSNIYTVFDAGFDATLLGCVGGTNCMNLARFSIGECDGRLYAVYSMFNWPGEYNANPTDDCGQGASVSNGANGEVYLSVSSDLQGTNWDMPRNLSNSYTPNCVAGECGDDRWASISSSFGQVATS